MGNFNRIPKFGDTSEDVRNLQSRLLELNFDPQGIDGVYGHNTQTAVSDFQKSKGLFGSGTIGERTLAFLGFTVGVKHLYNLFFLDGVTVDKQMTEHEGKVFYDGIVTTYIK